MCVRVCVCLFLNPLEMSEVRRGWRGEEEEGEGGRGRGGHFAKSLAVFVPTVKQNVSTNHRESPRISQWPQHPQASPKEMGACGFLTGQRVTRRVQEEEVEEVEGGGGGGGGGVQHRGQPKVWSWADDEQTTRPLKPLRTESSGW